MSEHLDDSSDQYMLVVPEAIHSTVEGDFLEVATYGNMDPEMRTEALAAYHGVEPEKILDATSARGRRLAVGFRRWNSSWDPHAAKADPNLN